MHRCLPWQRCAWLVIAMRCVLLQSAVTFVISLCFLIALCPHPSSASSSHAFTYRADVFDLGVEEQIISPLPLVNGTLPEKFSWGNVLVGSHSNGDPLYMSYLTTSRNQHINQYCASCWAHSVVGSLSDRARIALGGITQNAPYFSPQYLIACGKGSCSGGSVIGSYKWIHENGIVDDTCISYEGKDMKCEDINICRNCYFRNGTPSCWAIQDPLKWYTKEWGYCRGEEAMMNEIFARGPVASCVNDTRKGGIWETYKSGILVDPHPEDNGGSTHCIVIVGWGIKDSVKYWITRNSWGTYWGIENEDGPGYGHIRRGSNDFGIESGCMWATIDPTPRGGSGTFWGK